MNEINVFELLIGIIGSLFAIILAFISMRFKRSDKFMENISDQMKEVTEQTLVNGIELKCFIKSQTELNESQSKLNNQMIENLVKMKKD